MEWTAPDGIDGPKRDRENGHKAAFRIIFGKAQGKGPLHLRR